MSLVSYSAFFYGTLLHPKILKRVIENDGSHLQICPAVLLDHTRHKVKVSISYIPHTSRNRFMLDIKGADCPGMLPYTRSRVLFNADLDLEQSSVRGSLVQGLTNADMDFLDEFEGRHYRRETVWVHPLGSIVPLNTTISPDVRVPGSASTATVIAPEDPAPLPERSALAPSVECQTYIWCYPIIHLERELWSFGDFVKTNGWKWVSGSYENEDYNGVGRRRRRKKGKIVRGRS